MSVEDDQAAIVQALEAVPDITAYPDESPMMGAGDAIVQWAGWEPQGALLLFTATWKVFLVLGAEPRSAMRFLDEHLMAMLEAIDQLLFIVKVDRVQFPTATAGNLLGVEITGERES